MKRKKDKKPLDTIAFRIRNNISQDDLAYINKIYHQGKLSTFVNEAIEFYIFYKTMEKKMKLNNTLEKEKQYKKESINYDIVINDNKNKNNLKPFNLDNIDDFESEIYQTNNKNNDDFAQSLIESMKKLSEK